MVILPIGKGVGTCRTASTALCSAESPPHNCLEKGATLSLPTVPGDPTGQSKFTFDLGDPAAFDSSSDPAPHTLKDLRIGRHSRD